MNEYQQMRIDLLSSFFLFNRFIFRERTGKDFTISKPAGNISHFIEICDGLEDVYNGKILRLAINCPPGWSKSELVKNFVAWCMAWHDDSNFLYISYSHELAASHTASIKQTMMLPIYKKLFGVEISRETSAKDFFKTTNNGAVAAFGSSGAITGRDAGLPNCDRFSGAVIIDDIHKPDEVHSDGVRDKVIKNFEETIEPRCRGINVPIIMIGQRLHQSDIFNYVLKRDNHEPWHHINIKALDDAGNARYPEVMPKDKLLNMAKTKRYVFASQYQQDPIPAGGGLYQESDFPILDYTPEILSTFITADTSETEKEWNDKTVFSFWGLYQIKNKFVNVDDLYALHWLDCRQMNIEPKDLEPEFMDFWVSCMTYPVKPQFAIIEKKSTGVTLVSVLKSTQGMKILPIERTSASKSKTQRFIDLQSYIGKKQISLPFGAKHTKMCLDHMTSITANNTHAFDDIADTCYDAVKAAIIDKIMVQQVSHHVKYDDVASRMLSNQKRFDNLRVKANAK